MSSKITHTTLSVTNLSIGYKTKKESLSVANGINFSLAPGELVAIIGVNGIGKSTLLRTLGQIQPKLSGEIYISGSPLESYEHNALAQAMGIVLTEPIASKNMTVIELVALGRQPYTNWIGTLSEVDKLKITEALMQMELLELQHKKCFELSDGQLQRVMIARVLAQDTSIILLDEPTTHLDLYHKVQILKLLKSVAHHTGKAILFTSHEIELAIQLCDKMLLLDAKKNPFGKPTELIENKAFERLFPTDTIFFDQQTGSFRIAK